MRQKPMWVCIVVLFLLAAGVQAPDEKFAVEALPSASVTVLVDNMAGSGSELGEWGLAFLVNAGEHQFLFDAGGGRTLLGNANALEVDLSKTEAIVISHGHTDHTGGLDSALKACGPVDLFIHPAGFDIKYWKTATGATAERMPLSRQQLNERVRKLIETEGPTRICEGVMVTGQIPRVNDFEETGVGKYVFLDEDLKTPDPIQEDQAVFFRVPEGLVILVGCAHAGLVNTMRYVTELTGEQRIFAVIGGTHLLSASPSRMQKTIEALRQYDVQKIMLSHCTGVRAYAELAKAFPDRCSWPASGTRIQFGKQ